MEGLRSFQFAIIVFGKMTKHDRAPFGPTSIQAASALIRFSRWTTKPTFFVQNSTALFWSSIKTAVVAILVIITTFPFVARIAWRKPESRFDLNRTSSLALLRPAYEFDKHCYGVVGEFRLIVEDKHSGVGNLY